MVTLIIVSYFMVYLPAVFMRIADADIMTTKPTAYWLASILANSLVVVDPMVYIVFNEQYRDEVTALIKDVISFVSFTSENQA